MSIFDIYLFYMIWKVEFTRKAGGQVQMLSQKGERCIAVACERFIAKRTNTGSWLASLWQVGWKKE